MVYLWICFINSFEVILRLSIMATLVALIIFFIKLFFKERIGVRGNYFIWLILILRLLMPYTPQSKISFFNLFNHNYAMNKVINSSEVRLSNKEATKNIIKPDYKENTVQASSSKKTTVVNQYAEVAACVWAFGMIVLAFKMIVSTALFSNKLRVYKQVRDTDILDVLKECKSKIGVKRNIEVYRTNLVKVPGIFGIWRPKLLIPVNLEKKIEKDELKYIILHEVSHIKRKDIVIGCIVSIIQIIHWFNPVLWYSFYKMSIDREIACDALAMSALEEDQSSNYGMTILKVVRRIKNTNTMYGMESFVNSKYEVKRRIKMISKFKKKSYKLTVAALVLLIIVGASTLTNSRGIGSSGKNSSPKISQNKIIKTVKNKAKDVQKTNIAVTKSESSNNIDKLKSDSTKIASKSNDAVSNNKQKQSSSNSINDNMDVKVKDFILNGQQDIPEAGRIKWSDTFLNQVDIQDLYKKYISNGGKAGNVKSFAEYITINAPIQSNWQELFKKDLYNNYQEKVVKLVYLGGDLYQSYINNDGSEVPFVAVSARTGWFHG